MMLTAVDAFDDHFAALSGHRPFRWQRRLFDRFMEGDLPAGIDLPTGLGKTSVMAIWLIARAHGAKLPRRLVYVVDRRAVVDQATEEAEKLRAGLEQAPELKAALRLDDRALPISTLRGQFIDNRDWLADPAAPAIVVGTVDMIGSRLLFSGYGVSRKMRPYHAGLLGADTLLVLDEAHLVPPFEKLLEAVACRGGGEKSLGPVDDADRKIIPPFKLLSLSATGRNRQGELTPFRLAPQDRDDAIVARRLDAAKALTIDTASAGGLADRLADEAWTLAGDGKIPIRCVVYCNSRTDAEAVKEDLDERFGLPTPPTELFVGARRVKEREDAKDWLKRHGFLAGSEMALDRPAFLVATSAGEVGVDLDADHMVCDLVPWERMVQRLGRVNRRGERDDTRVLVIDSGDAKKDEQLAKALDATRTLLGQLPEISGGRHASPAAILALREKVGSEKIKIASTAEPLHPALTRPLVDAWSMTSLEEHTGRPDIAPWLRGWVDEDQPQTGVVWRKYLPVRAGGNTVLDEEVEDFFEAAPPHASELLETETWRVVDWLVARATALKPRPRRAEAPEAQKEEAAGATDATLPANRPADPPLEDDVVAFSFSSAGDLEKSYQLREFVESSGKKLKDQLVRKLVAKTLVVDARLGGLIEGMLKAKSDIPPRTADDGEEWVMMPQKTDTPSTLSAEPIVKFRVRRADTIEETGRCDAEWHKPFLFRLSVSPDGEPLAWLVVEKWKGASTTEDEKSVSRAQYLDEHQEWTADKAAALAEKLSLHGDFAKALVIAARLHDEGKRAERWQRAFSAPRQKDERGNWKIFAKTQGPFRSTFLDGYRHEFGSLWWAEKDAEFNSLPGDLRDLVLHLIAAHHGSARPIIETKNCERGTRLERETQAREVALRFARLQKRWGPWGNAWWEALLRSADQQASRKNDALGEKTGEFAGVAAAAERQSDGRG